MLIYDVGGGGPFPGCEDSLRGEMICLPVCCDCDVGVYVSLCRHQWPRVVHEDRVGITCPDVEPEGEKLSVKSDLF